jgi:hypothetical protein
LTDWLETVDQKTVYNIHDEMFTLVAGFCRSGYTHEILQSKTSKEYKWWIRDSIFEASCPKDPYIWFPKEKYSSLQEVLENMIEYYSRKWKLAE